MCATLRPWSVPEHRRDMYAHTIQLQLVSSCFGFLRQTLCIRRSLPRSSLLTLITASKVDYRLALPCLEVVRRHDDDAVLIQVIVTCDSGDDFEDAHTLLQMWQHGPLGVVTAVACLQVRRPSAAWLDSHLSVSQVSRHMDLSSARVI